MIKRLTAVVLCAAMITAALAGCSAGTDGAQSPSASQPGTSESVSGPPISGEGTTSASPPPSGLSTVEAFLYDEPDGSAVGQYLLDNAASLAPSDAELLLERLILLQQDIAAELNTRVWETDYLTALNETMGGVLDPDKIDNIPDVLVRADFREASDAVMTIVRYEETPVFETDWARVATLGNVFSEPVLALIEYQSRLQGVYYRGNPIKFDLLAADIAAVETLLAEADGFARWQLRQLWAHQTSVLFYGAEGEHLDFIMNGDSVFVSLLQGFADEYAGTRFADICAQLVAYSGDDFTELSLLIESGLVFPPDSTYRAQFTHTIEDDMEYALVEISGGDDPAVTQSINDAINDATQALMQIDDGETYIRVRNYVSVCGQYLSIDIYYSGLRFFHETMLVLDLKTGQPVTLDDLTGKPLDEYKEALLGVVPQYAGQYPLYESDLVDPLEFTLSNDSLTIMLHYPDRPEYYTVTINGLREIMDVRTLY